MKSIVFIYWKHAVGLDNTVAIWDIGTSLTAKFQFIKGILLSDAMKHSVDVS